MMRLTLMVYTLMIGKMMLEIIDRIDYMNELLKNSGDSIRIEYDENRRKKCMTNNELLANESFAFFKSGQVLSNIEGNEEGFEILEDLDGMIVLTYKFLYELEKGNPFFEEYYSDIRKYMEWNEENWRDYNLTGLYKTYPIKVEMLYQDLLNEFTKHDKNIPRWLSLNKFILGYSYTFLNHFKVNNTNEIVLLPLLSSCFDNNPNNQPNHLIITKTNQSNLYEIASTTSFDADDKLSYINHQEQLSNDYLLLFNQTIVKSNKHNTFLLNFTFKDPNFNFYSHLYSTNKYNMSLITKSTISEEIQVAIPLQLNKINADLFLFALYYGECRKCSPNFPRSISYEIQAIKNSFLYYWIILANIEQIILQMPQQSLQTYITNTTDKTPIHLFNLENIHLQHTHLSTVYNQIIRFQWTNLQTYKHSYINAL